METSNKTWAWVLIAVVVLALFWAVWYYGSFSRPAAEKEAPVSDSDTTTEIDKDLNAVDIGDPNQDLKRLDADLNQL